MALRTLTHTNTKSKEHHCPRNIWHLVACSTALRDTLGWLTHTYSPLSTSSSWWTTWLSHTTLFLLYSCDVFSETSRSPHDANCTGRSRTALTRRVLLRPAPNPVFVCANAFRYVLLRVHDYGKRHRSGRKSNSLFAFCGHLSQRGAPDFRMTDEIRNSTSGDELQAI
jgi:hypothetical protein